MYIVLHVKYPTFLSDFSKTWIFWRDFWKIFRYQISWKSVQWSQVTRGQTIMMKLIVSFHNFENGSKILGERQGGLRYHSINIYLGLEILTELAQW